jgi:hypothetical protein
MTTAIERASKDFMQAGHHYGATLYELDAQAEAILFMLDSAESDEERESLLAELNLNEMLVQGKVESYLAVISSLEHLAEGRTAAAKRMKAREPRCRRTRHSGSESACWSTCSAAARIESKHSNSRYVVR